MAGAEPRADFGQPGDTAGRLIWNLYAVNDKARVGALIVDTRSPAAGIYLVRLETAKGSATCKLVIDR